MRVVVRKHEHQIKQVSYAALAAGRTSGVWVDEDREECNHCAFSSVTSTPHSTSH